MAAPWSVCQQQHAIQALSREKGPFHVPLVDAEPADSAKSQREQIQLVSVRRQKLRLEPEDQAALATLATAEPWSETDKKMRCAVAGIAR